MEQTCVTEYDNVKYGILSSLSLFLLHNHPGQATKHDNPIDASRGSYLLIYSSCSVCDAKVKEKQKDTTLILSKLGLMLRFLGGLYGMN